MGRLRPGLKTIDDATYIRRRILLAFEKAETETDPAERARLLNFVIVGGGPTGVEMAGAIAELANRALAKDFRSIDPRAARIILVEAAPRLLTPFDPRSRRPPKPRSNSLAWRSDRLAGDRARRRGRVDRQGLKRVSRRAP